MLFLAVIPLYECSFKHIIVHCVCMVTDHELEPPSRLDLDSRKDMDTPGILDKLCDWVG